MGTDFYRDVFDGYRNCNFHGGAVYRSAVLPLLQRSRFQFASLMSAIDMLPRLADRWSQPWRALSGTTRGPQMLSEVGAVSAVQAGSKVREIEDPLTWAFYFLALLAVSVEDPKAKEMAAYAQLIIHLSQRHGGRGWLAYDRLFRQQAAAGCSHPWNQLAPSLLATTIMTPGPTKRSCELCNGADHTTSQCALFHASSISKSLPAGTPDTPTKRMKVYEPCRCFNRGNCHNALTCKFVHNCSTCGDFGHTALTCTGKPEPPRFPSWAKLAASQASSSAPASK